MSYILWRDSCLIHYGGIVCLIHYGGIAVLHILENKLSYTFDDHLSYICRKSDIIDIENQLSYTFENQLSTHFRGTVVLPILRICYLHSLENQSSTHFEGTIILPILKEQLSNLF